MVDTYSPYAKHAAPIHPGTGTDQSVHGVGAEVVEPDNPYYHGTPQGSLESIARHGLRSNLRVRNDWGESRGEDYDFPREQELIYFTNDETSQWVKDVETGNRVSKWKVAILRFDGDTLPPGVAWDEDVLRPGEFYLFSDTPFEIPPEEIHYKDLEDGEWRPLTSLIAKHADHDQSTHGNWADGITTDAEGNEGVDEYRTGGDLAGEVTWTVFPNRLFIGNVSVHPHHRRRGIATGLVRNLLSRHPDVKVDLAFFQEDGLAWVKAVGNDLFAGRTVIIDSDQVDEVASHLPDVTVEAWDITKHGAGSHDESSHGNWSHGSKVFPVEDASGTFHYVATDRSKPKRGREKTLCGLDTSNMRSAAPFAVGDSRGAVHLERGHDECVDILANVEFDKHAQGLHDQSTHGNWAEGILAEVIPPQPGESPIPENTYRMFHVSPLDNLASIQESGLTLSTARGETYGEPNAIWLSNQTDYWKDPRGSVLIEVAIPADQVDDNFLVIGGPRGNMAVPYDIPSEWIVAIHEPWHSTYHFLSDPQSRQRVMEGWYDDILEDETLVAEGKAITRIKAEEQGVTKHMGPGDHPSGSSQAVHAGGAGQGTLFSAPRIPLYEELGFDEEVYDEFLSEAYSEWTYWAPSKDIRMAALRRAGLTPESVPADPHIDSPAPSETRFGLVEPDHAAAAFMEEIAQGRERFDRLYRGVSLRRVSREELEFFENLKPGDEFDAPLLGFLNVDPMVGHENYLDKFGTDVLFELEGASAWDSHQSFSEPIWGESDEQYFLETIEENGLSIFEEAWADDSLTFFQSDFNSPQEAWSDLQDALTRYRSAEPNSKFPIRNEIDALLDYTYHPLEERRWAGHPIPEDSEEYYDWLDNAEFMEGYPREVISGGRFRVTAIEEDPRQLYDKVVKLAQVGAFDPRMEGTLIEKARRVVLSSDEWAGLHAYRNRPTIAKLYSPYAKHMGPGPHPSGSSQSVHGGGAVTILPDLDSPRDNLSAADQVDIRFNLRRLSHLSGEQLSDFKLSARAAVGRFQRMYPDSAIGQITFEGMPSPEMRIMAGDGTMAYVNPNYPNTVVVNEDLITSARLKDTIDEIHLASTAPIRLSVGVEVYRHHDRRWDKLIEATLFHEVAHVAEEMTSPISNVSIPRFDTDWFPEKRIDFPTNPAIPSKYASFSPSEYFAEALTDIAFFGDQAREHSKLTHQVYSDYLESLGEMR